MPPIENGGGIIRIIVYLQELNVLYGAQMRDAVFAAVSGILYFRFGKVTELGLWGPLRWGFIDRAAAGSELPLYFIVK